MQEKFELSRKHPFNFNIARMPKGLYPFFCKNDIRLFMLPAKLQRLSRTYCLQLLHATCRAVGPEEGFFFWEMTSIEAVNLAHKSKLHSLCLRWILDQILGTESAHSHLSNEKMGWWGSHPMGLAAPGTRAEAGQTQVAPAHLAPHFW